VNAFRDLIALTIEGQMSVTPAYIMRRGRAGKARPVNANRRPPGYAVGPM
jgi:hypothetical protein